MEYIRIKRERESKTLFLEKEKRWGFFSSCSLFHTNGTLYEIMGYLCFLI